MKNILLLVLMVLSVKGWSQSCQNLDFESGDFTGWELSRPNAAVITSGSGTDTYGGFPVVAPGGSYSAKLGDTARNNNILSRLDFQLDVTPENTFFAYRFAFVLEDAPSDESLLLTGYPEMSFRVFRDREFGVVQCSSLGFRAYNTPGMKKVAGQNIHYLPWTTYILDLSRFIGQRVTIEVDIEKGTYLDANNNRHYLFAYGYFDSFCSIPVAVSGNKCTYSPTQFSVNFETAFPDATFTWNMGDGTILSDGKSVSHTYTEGRDYNVSVSYNPHLNSWEDGGPVVSGAADCGSGIASQTVSISNCAPSFVCEDCIPAFSPLPGQKYILTAWVKEGDGIGKHTYDIPGITVRFSNGTAFGPFKASGLIIDGWQRIEGEFIVPASAKDIAIELHNNDNTAEVFFDDIRVQPYNSSMKAFVYDPVTLRLVSELDERNYATFYEYDEEGILTRVKKETERGVKTIRETRESLRKRP